MPPMPAVTCLLMGGVSMYVFASEYVSTVCESVRVSVCLWLRERERHRGREGERV